jgi:hypothetical protein
MCRARSSARGVAPNVVGDCERSRVPVMSGEGEVGRSEAAYDWSRLIAMRSATGVIRAGASDNGGYGCRVRGAVNWNGVRTT